MSLIFCWQKRYAISVSLNWAACEKEVPQIQFDLKGNIICQPGKLSLICQAGELN